MNSENACQATNRQRCEICGFWGRIDGPLEDPEYFPLHSCISNLKGKLAEEKRVSQINHAAAERCAGERNDALRALLGIRDMPSYDQDDHCRLRHKAQMFLETVPPPIIDSLAKSLPSPTT